MSTGKAKPDLVCWDCGAANRPNARECWLCGRRDWLSSAIRFDELRGAARDELSPPPRNRSHKAAMSLGEAFLLGCGSAAALFFVMFILPLMMVLSSLISLLRICTGQGH